MDRKIEALSVTEQEVQAADQVTSVTDIVTNNRFYTSGIIMKDHKV